ncbi:MAG: YcxB family protein [Candidatus Thiodiazotropha sp.]
MLNAAYLGAMREKMEPVTLKYSEQFIKNAIRSYWWKNIGPILPSVSLLLTAFVIYRAFDGDRSWFIGVIGAIVVITLAVMVASYFINLSRSLSRLKRMKIPEATLELGEERFKVASDVGSSEMQWSLVKQIWCFEHAWLLLFTGSEFMTLPTDGLSDEAKSFITERARANGAKIK